MVPSNVDRESSAKTNADSLQGFRFDLVITTQDVGSYKPDLRNSEYMLQAVQSEFNINSAQVPQTAQSQFPDHYPARQMGLRSVWIKRPGATMGNLSENVYDWKFDTLGEMADALERDSSRGAWLMFSFLAFVFIQPSPPNQWKSATSHLEEFSP